MIEWHSCGSFRVIDEPKTLALFAQQQKHHPHHIITISSFTVHDYVVHASFIRGSELFFCKIMWNFEYSFINERRLNEVQALYTVKHFCSCSDLLQSQFLLTKRNEMNKTKKFCLFIIIIPMSIHQTFIDCQFIYIIPTEVLLLIAYCLLLTAAAAAADADAFAASTFAATAAFAGAAL
ncbi:hypothetical protein T12_5900 [Trichinella patagoniensis]|uniref:Uncharacterized protein n=1 Tax=Trichinella patagoniensis TaxID=990121 RepID=A0A0V1A9F7_9BILA|nr:hypothetical protein T12_5900 [Trichinella patagoniensis]